MLRFLNVFLFRLTTQCEKCGEQLYPGLHETSSNSCKCKKQQSKGLFSQQLEIDFSTVLARDQCLNVVLFSTDTMHRESYCLINLY